MKRRVGPAGPGLSPLEQDVMAIVWKASETTAEDIGRALAARDLKNATIRTLLRRMEEKGFVAHRVAGRAFVYRAAVAPHRAAAGAVRRILDRFCGGSVEQLLVGLLDARVVNADELQTLSRKVARARPARAKGEADAG